NVRLYLCEHDLDGVVHQCLSGAIPLAGGTFATQVHFVPREQTPWILSGDINVGKPGLSCFD
ncbi:MAG: hypothetical protein V3V52_10915, partial [Candidatus Adiutricales bacterium]